MPRPTYAEVDAFRDICQHYLNTAVTDDESGEDRSLVIIQVAAEQLLDSEPEHVPAGTSPDEPTHAGHPSLEESAAEPIGDEHRRSRRNVIGRADPSPAALLVQQSAAERIRDEHRPAGTSLVGSAEDDHPSAAALSREPVRAEHVPAGTSPVGPAQADPPSAAPLSGQPIRVDQTSEGSLPDESVHADHPSVAAPDGEPIRVGDVPAGTSLRVGVVHDPWNGWDRGRDGAAASLHRHGARRGRRCPW